MAINALNILSGIGAAAAGLAGDKVAKDGVIPGFDIGTIVTSLLGKSGGGLLGTITSVATKSGVLNSSNLGKVAELAGSLFSVGKTKEAETKEKGGIAGLAAAIMGGSGDGAGLASIASMALKLGKTAKDEPSLLSMAADLGSTLSGKFGLSFGGSEKTVSALDKVMEGDAKTAIFKSILTGIIK